MGRADVQLEGVKNLLALLPIVPKLILVLQCRIFPEYTCAINSLPCSFCHASQ